MNPHHPPSIISKIFLFYLYFKLLPTPTQLFLIGFLNVKFTYIGMNQF